MKPVFLRTAHNYDPDEVSNQTAIDCNVDQETGEVMPSLTHQSFKEECDINEIVRRFGLTGQLPENFQAPQSGDFTGITDYQSAMNAIRQAEEQFMELPGELRERFEHDPQRLINFMEDPNNREEATKLGLVNKPPEKTRDAVQAIDELRTALTPAKT